MDSPFVQLYPRRRRKNKC